MCSPFIDRLIDRMEGQCISFVTSSHKSIPPECVYPLNLQTLRLMAHASNFNALLPGLTSLEGVTLEFSPRDYSRFGILPGHCPHTICIARWVARWVDRWEIFSQYLCTSKLSTSGFCTHFRPQSRLVTLFIYQLLGFLSRHE